MEVHRSRLSQVWLVYSGSVFRCPQVWRGALLLADYILHQEATTGCFRGVTALELGAGTGTRAIRFPAEANGLEMALG